MFTYTSRRNLFGTLSNDSSTANLTVGDTLMNAFEKKISKKFNFLEGSLYSSTVASQQFYELPNNFGRLNNVTVTISDTKHSPKLITTREQWDLLNMSGTPTSDIPEFYYIFNKEIGFFPIPASATTDAIYIQFHKNFRDLTLADYTTGTITSIANGGTAVVGSGTVWTAKMAGMWIRITDSSTASLLKNFQAFSSARTASDAKRKLLIPFFARYSSAHWEAKPPIKIGTTGISNFWFISTTTCAIF